MMAEKGFFNLDICASEMVQKDKVVLLSVPTITPYKGRVDNCSSGIKVLRDASKKFENKKNSWDFDTNSSLEQTISSMVDLGNFSLKQNPEKDRAKLIEKIKFHISNGNKIIILGGDDSVSIPPILALEPLKKVHILQIDAHLDWKDHVGEEKFGRSNVMKRASECEWVEGITQIGLRGLGTSSENELWEAKKWGVNIITSLELLDLKVEEIVEITPKEIPVYISLDLDGVNPSALPSVDSPVPGGPSLSYIIALIKKLGEQRRLTGANFVEFSPTNDINDLGKNASIRLLTVLCNSLTNSYK
jgi:agmatinase